MKKLSTLLLIAFALVLGLSQCKKKNIDTINPAVPVGEPVHITLNVGGGDKHLVLPNIGAVVYTDGDKIYVGNNGKYIGTLVYEDGAFSGTIYGPSTDDYLHFYFVGGLETGDITEGITTSFTVNIADQSSNLPVLSYGRSTQRYTNGSATYSCTLLNKCGLVKFVPSIVTDETITVGGMKTSATIDFRTGYQGITPTETTGSVTLYSESNKAKWAILLPQAEVSDPTVTISLVFSGTITTVPAITNNTYYNTGVGITMAINEGVLNGEFTVNSSGKKVAFSQGNLQYTRESTSDDWSTGKWSFMENQYSIGETSNVSTDYANQTVVSLFGLGTTGYQDTRTSSTGYQTNYDPYSTSNAAVSSSSPAYNINRYGYGPDCSSGTNYGLTVTNQSDWGMHPITNGGDAPGAWRTLTRAEWVWILGPKSSPNPGTNCRRSSTVNGTSNARFTYATINTVGTSVKGMIIFPDIFNISTPLGVTWGTINNYSNYTTTCTSAGWSSLEAAGCVFLPAAGYRYSTTVYDVGSTGLYWSSSCLNSSNAYGVFFNSSNFDSYSSERYRGYSVRLVTANE